MAKTPFTYEEFKEIYSKVPRLCVDLVIQTPSGIILALRQLPSWNKMWHLPGGTVLYRETVEQAVHRVAGDELGIKVQIKNLIGYIEYPSEEKERGFGCTISMAFLCSTAGGNLKLNDEASKAGTFSELPDNTVFEQKHFLESHNLI